MPSPDEAIEATRLAVRAEKDAHDRWQDALAARDAKVRALYELAPDLGPTAMGSAIGLNPSTVRAITRDLAAARRRAR